ncbi:MAG: serpin family protein [Firmicutes bacterium]|nr:serpin family protein [Bacillota bacterium]
MKRRVTSGILIIIMLMLTTLCPLAGCGTSAQTAAPTDLMKNIKPDQPNAGPVSAPGPNEAIADFAVRLFQNSLAKDGNTLIAPVSVLSALAMTANGAKGETLTQMEKVCGLSTGELNEYLNAYLKSLPNGDKYKLHSANSIWFKDDDKVAVKQDFLQLNADYYDAAVYKTAFNAAALKAINAWISEQTEGMIKNMLSEIAPDAVMYLVNALAFDAEWENIYTEVQVSDGSFTSAAGQKRVVKMMHGTEEMYLADGKATGFIKYYAGRKYAFVALLPDQGVAINDYVSSLTGAGLMNVLAKAQNVPVVTALPKFKSEYAVTMNDTLRAMGMTDAFDPKLADFTGLATMEGDLQGQNICISRLLHKTYIAVNEKGTQAGAASVVEMGCGAALEPPPKTVILDRPFVYMLIDCTSHLPLFIGMVTDIEA